MSNKGNMDWKEKKLLGLPWWLSGEESACQFLAHEFDPWSGNIPHCMEQLSPSTTISEPVLQSLAAATTEAHTP